MTSRIWLTVFLLSPALMVAAILYSIRSPDPSRGPSIGAGAANTGGANAIGELLAGHKATYNAQAEAQRESIAGDQPATDRKLAQPEELPQGFIVIVEDKAKRASEASPIYFASSINGWNPRDEKFRLTAQSDGKWRIILPQKSGGGLIEFKLTRGSWALEELDADLKTIPNRYFPKVDISKLQPGEQPRVELVVPAWGDQRAQDPALQAKDPYRHLKVTGTVRRVEVRGGSGGAERMARDCLVWLPPGYDDPQNAARTYPVIYLQDGQNLFEKMPGTPAEWNVDETASKLIAAGEIQPVIIVGIPNSEGTRISEYLPAAALPNVSVAGSRYIEFLTSEVMPRINRLFRVKTAPEHTGIGGASLGAAIALHGINTRPEVFGLLLAESLPLTAGDAAAWDTYISELKAFPTRAFIGIGGHELGKDPANAQKNQALVEASKRFDSLLAKAGLDKSRRLMVIGEEDEHNEIAWSKRLPDALRFLFPPSMSDSAK
ncbi:MAG: alpha/beta hydrolase [Phycisphaerales bacterium]|nr:alpha/beta hydrolase [Phycisphaerales bacterium]